ncbi:acryloyl-CoA reductase [Arthrobacter sp. NyZ413]|uniref:acrylyl-CoA reductase family protein n=1 Tax=Arthrobacter sp. NyZ413 TaxID=3144669 RepID=UPI003BF8E9D5
MSNNYRAFVAGTDKGAYVRGVREVAQADLPEGSVRVRVAYSDVNYKDHLAASENGRVARIDPIIPGIDFAGEIIQSKASEWSSGDVVLAHGYDIGVSRDGGFAEEAIVPSEWLVRLPKTMTARRAVTIGTAGFTAGLSVQAILDAGIKPSAGPVLVTGATGGVGSVAIALLSQLGYTVVASTGRVERADWLTQLGASEVIDRLPSDAKPLGRETWAAAVDSVGGTTLHAALAGVRYGGIVAASGNTGGMKLDTTVFPFILRAVSLVGIDSVQCPMSVRQDTWDWIAATLDERHYDLLAGEVVNLDGVDDALQRIASGSAEGRTLVELAN